jgi:hypothetical protein
MVAVEARDYAGFAVAVASGRVLASQADLNPQRQSEELPWLSHNPRPRAMRFVPPFPT